MKFSWIFLVLFLLGCNSSSDSTKEVDSAEKVQANITEVTAQGDNGNYIFYVTIESDETGCDQYADWWEVLSSDGKLVYRRVLLHSHPDDQPFTRSGNPVNIQADDVVYIRAHLNNKGYSGDVFKGSVTNGFLKTGAIPDFSGDIEDEQPLPNGCAF